MNKQEILEKRRERARWLFLNWERIQARKKAIKELLK